MQLAPAPRTMPRSSELDTVYIRGGASQPSDLPLLVAKILELLDGQRALAEIFEEAQISAEKGLAVVRKLSRLGMIATAPTRPSRTMVSDLSPSSAFERAETLRGLPALPRAGFTAAEEAFFASEVEPLEEEEQESGLGHRFSLFISDLVLYLRRDVAL